MHDSILWQEIYEQALELGMDRYSAEVYATDTLEAIEEDEAYDRLMSSTGVE